MSKTVNQPQAVRFGFDTAFAEPGSDSAGSRQSRSFSQTDLDEARRDGFDKGQIEGRDDALNGIEARIAAQLEDMACQITQMLQAWGEVEDRMLREAAIMAHAVAGKLAPGLIAKAPIAEIETLVTQVVEERTQEPRLVVRICEQDLEAARERIEQLAQAHGFAGDVILLAEDGMTGGDCRVEWAEGGVERCFRHTAATIDTALARFLDESKQAAEPEAEGQNL